MSLEIRDALASEYDDFAKVAVAAYRQYQKAMPPSAFRHYLKDIADIRSRMPASTLIVALCDGKPAGSVTFYPDGSKSEGEGWPKGWTGVRILAVHPKFRGLGIGRALMEECIRRSRALGAIAVGLHTTKAMDVARPMYERMGFVRIPKFDFHPRPEVTVMAYRLDLVPGGSTEISRVSHG